MSQNVPEVNTELSFKDLVFRVRSLVGYLKSKWVTIVFVGVLGACLGLIYSIIVAPRYTAVCTFVLDENGRGSGGLGQYASLASLAGLDVSTGGGMFQGDNIIELYKSRSMLEKTLLSVCDIDGKRQMLIDRYIDFNHLREKWASKHIENTKFDTSPDKFNRVQDSIITNIVMVFNTTALNVAKPDKKLSIIQVQFVSKDELFSKEFTNALVSNVNSFYILTKTKKTLQNVLILQRQADSVRLMLNSSINGVASAIDATPNANPTHVTLRVPSQKRQIDVQANSSIYTEMVKNLEISKITLRQETPLIQVIDKPVLPLAMERVGKIKGIAIGLIAGFFLSVIVLLSKKLYLGLIK